MTGLPRQGYSIYLTCQGNQTVLSLEMSILHKGKARTESSGSSRKTVLHDQIKKEQQKIRGLQTKVIVVIYHSSGTEVTSQTGSDVIIVNSCRFEAFFPTGSDVMTPEVPVSCTCTVFNPTPGSFPPPPLGAMGRGGESDVTNKNDVIYLFLST